MATTYTLSEIKNKYLDELNKVTSDRDIINTNIEKDFVTLDNLCEGEGKHIYLSSYYYSGVCDLGDKDDLSLFSKYNWRKYIILTIKRISDGYTLDYGIIY